MAENGSLLPEPQSQPETTAGDAETAVSQAEQLAGAEPPAAESEVAAATGAEDSNNDNSNTGNKWPGWPGDCVFRLVVPVLKVGSIIGRKGELIKKMCEETRARIRVLDGSLSSPDRIVLIYGKEEPEAPLSPAMDAVLRVSKRVSGIPETEGDNKMSGTAGVAFCSVRLLVASTQAINLIGKQGSLIKSIQETTGSSIRVLSNEEVPAYVSKDERIVELQGEASKVLKALEAVVGHLRKFLVDHSVLPLFEKNYNATVSQERPVESWTEKPSLHTAPQVGRVPEYSLPVKREPYLYDRDSQLVESQVPSSLSYYGQDPALSGISSSSFGRAGGPILTQVTHTMQIPLGYAEDIIGVAGSNIGYIRRTSGAILTVEESRGLPDEITVEIRGTSSQVQTAQQLIEEFMSVPPRETHTRRHGSKLDTGLQPPYSSSRSTYTPSYSAYHYGGYGSSGVGGYSSFRI